MKTMPKWFAEQLAGNHDYEPTEEERREGLLWVREYLSENVREDVLQQAYPEWFSDEEENSK